MDLQIHCRVFLFKELVYRYRVISMRLFVLALVPHIQPILDSPDLITHISFDDYLRSV